jgi:thiamine kinase-like enzyme
MSSLNPYLQTAHIQNLMHAWQQQKVEVLAVEPYAIDNSASILVTLTAMQSEQLIGHFGLCVHFRDANGEHRQNMVLKVKPHGRDISGMLTGLAQMSEPELGEVYAQYAERTGFYNTHLRELEVYAQLPQPLQPKIYGILALPEQQSYQILMEDLSGMELLNSVMAPSAWTDQHIRQALRTLAAWHAHAYQQLHLLQTENYTDTSSEHYLKALQPLWEVLLQKGAERFPEQYPPALVSKLQGALRRLPELESNWANLPKTLIHNDANPRNSCFREDGTFCLYDWELACFEVPVYDAVEFLSFVLHEQNQGAFVAYLDFYQAELAALWPFWKEEVAFKKSVEWAAVHFGLHRLGMYMMAHAVAPYPFLPRVMHNYAALMANLLQE